MYDHIACDRRAVEVEDVPEPTNPYSRAIVHGGLVYLSGVVAANMVTGELEADDIRGQTKAVLENLERVLMSAGSDLAGVLRMSVYLIDPSDFAGMNEVYREMVPEPRPARTTVTVARLGRPEFLLEIDLIACVH
jgi:2-iminobutanoate/2-iminopropanoate deaminase